MGEACVTMALLQSIFSKLSMLQEKLESYMTLTSPRNLFPVNTQHRVKRLLLQRSIYSRKPLFPWILTVKYVGFKCDGIIMTDRGIKVL